MEIALYTRKDGLLEARSERAWDYFKSLKPGSLLVGNFFSDNRTTLQNKYLNGWVYRQAVAKLNESGQSIHGIPWTRDSLHAVAQVMFLVKHEFPHPDTGEVIAEFESTATMSKKRFTDYVDGQLIPYIRDAFGIEIFPPNQHGSSDSESFYHEVHKAIFS